LNFINISIFEINLTHLSVVSSAKLGQFNAIFVAAAAAATFAKRHVYCALAAVAPKVKCQCSQLCL